MQTNEIQELLLATIPAWHYWFARPAKRKRMIEQGKLPDCPPQTKKEGHCR